MVDGLTCAQAAGSAAYSLTRLRKPGGAISAHYLHPQLVPDEESFARLMNNSHFAEIIGMEESTEDVADGPLDALQQLAPTSRARDLFLQWLAFINTDLDPWTTGGSIHFRPHWARVLMLSLALGEAEGLSLEDFAALCAASVFHDSRRRDPYLDTGHGARAAQYYRKFCAENEAASRGEGEVASLADSETALPPRQSVIGRTIAFDPRVFLVIAWHDRDDEAGITAIERSVREGRLYAPAEGDDRANTTGVSQTGYPAISENELKQTLLLYRLFKDSDGLDRIRLGEYDLDVRYLRTAHAKEMLPLARKLLALTNGS